MTHRTKAQVFGEVKAGQFKAKNATGTGIKGGHGDSFQDIGGHMVAVSAHWRF